MQKWDKIRSGCKITLEQDTKFNGFDGLFTLSKGQYYIVGFWANACGLSTKKQDLYDQISVNYIPAISLKEFKEVEK